jgi:hypothetical protein
MSFYQREKAQTQPLLSHANPRPHPPTDQTTVSSLYKSRPLPFCNPALFNDTWGEKKQTPSPTNSINHGWLDPFDRTLRRRKESPAAKCCNTIGDEEAIVGDIEHFEATNS